MQTLNKTHQKTLKDILKTPILMNIEWRRVEALFKAIGAKIIEGNGSRVRIELNGVVGTFHKPHPQKEIKRYQVKDVREFLEKTRVVP